MLFVCTKTNKSEKDYKERKLREELNNRKKTKTERTGQTQEGNDHENATENH